MNAQGPENWRAELESIVAEQNARRIDYQRGIEERYAAADLETQQMFRNTLAHICGEHQAEIEAYQEETRVLLAKAQAAWSLRRQDAERDDMSGEVKAALAAILGETVDEK